MPVVSVMMNERSPILKLCEWMNIIVNRCRSQLLINFLFSLYTCILLSVLLTAPLNERNVASLIETQRSRKLTFMTKFLSLIDFNAIIKCTWRTAFDGFLLAFHRFTSHNSTIQSSSWYNHLIVQLKRKLSLSTKPAVALCWHCCP